MYIIGYLLYAATIAAIVYIPTVTDLVTVSYKLATEIVLGCGIMSIYPILLFTYYLVMGKRGQKEKAFFTTITTNCANIVVSLGLIGTFVGLTRMIDQISGAVSGGSGSVDEQIAGIMVAIGNSLNSMSFAFLTSVMGVAASVVIGFAGNYFRTYFTDTSDEGDEEGESVSLDETGIVKLTAEQNKIKAYINKLITGSIDKREMASIVVANTMTTKELSKIVTTLVGEMRDQKEALENLALITKSFTEKQGEDSTVKNQLISSISDLKESSSAISDSLTKIGNLQEEQTSLIKQNTHKKENIAKTILNEYLGGRDA